MFFRLAGRMDQFPLADESVEFAGPSGSTIVLREPSAEEQTPNEPKRPDARCTVTIECEPPAGFEATVSGRHVAMNFAAFSAEKPNTQGVLRKIRSQLAEAVIQVLNTLRWRLNRLGPPDPLTDVAFLYSFDGLEWGEIQPVVFWRRSWNPPVYLGENGQKLVAALLEAGETEPIGYDLLREAHMARFRNPRSSLILAVAALEVGVKQGLSRLVADITWLVDNLPTPPVAEILRHYIPQLLAQRGELKLYAPPNELLKVVDDAVQARNTFVHRLPGSRRYAKAMAQLEYLPLEAILGTVNDFLCLLDYYAGAEWAINRVRTSTIQLLIDRNEGLALPHMTSPTPSAGHEGENSFCRDPNELGLNEESHPDLGSAMDQSLDASP